MSTVCPVHNRRFTERIANHGWCLECDHCEEGFADGDVVRLARINRNGGQPTVVVHRRCWSAWCIERVANRPWVQHILNQWNGRAS